MFFSEAFQSIIAEKSYIQKYNRFVTLWLCYHANFKYLHPCNDITLSGVNYIRENGALLAHLGAPKTSQFWKYFLYYMTKKIIWSINELTTDRFSTEPLYVYEISSLLIRGGSMTPETSKMECLL